jgi:hypothetical protein
MIIYVDIDNTICRTIGTQYDKAAPFRYIIDRINGLRNAGHTIIYWTARGVGTGIDHRELTAGQLKDWGAEYDELRLDKPVFDLLVDDKAVTKFEDLDFNNGYGGLNL